MGENKLDFNDIADQEESGIEISEAQREELNRINKAIEPELEQAREALKILEPFLNDEGRIDRETLKPFLNDDGSLNADKIKEFQNQIATGVNLDRLLIPKDKATRSFFQGKMTGGQEIELILARNENKEITSDIIVYYPIIEGMEISNKDISLFDYTVYYAISSLYEASESKIFSIPTIYRNMIGNPEGKCTDNNYKEISDSIRKLSRTNVIIKDTKGAKLWGYDEVKIEENMLLTTRLTVKSGGHKVTGIEIVKKPILYWYASLKNHIARIPAEALNAPINNTKLNFELKTFLIDKVEWFRGNGKQKNDTILYDEIYKTMETLTPSAKRNIRENTRVVLNHWKKIKFIKDFKENRGAKNSIISIKITI